jgi:hypothetical protein
LYEKHKRGGVVCGVVRERKGKLKHVQLLKNNTIAISSTVNSKQINKRI